MIEALRYLEAEHVTFGQLLVQRGRGGGEHGA
jgi:hypothetical protein